MSSPESVGNQLRGGPILREVREAYRARYHDTIAASDKAVAIVRFAPSASEESRWSRRMEASRVSAAQKVKNISALGFEATEITLPDQVSVQQFRQVLDRCNRDERTSGVIVQMPTPERLGGWVEEELDPTKDIDALLGEDSPYGIPATSAGLSRLVLGTARDDDLVAVAGAEGFVGSGVVSELRSAGTRVLPLDVSDDLRQMREADLVVSATGQPGLLTREHLSEHHRLVVDSGFMPTDDGGVSGDVARDAYDLPQQLTPVPGGAGPVEMAILLERLARKDADPNLPAWHYLGPEKTQHTSLGGEVAQPAPENTAARLSQLGSPVPVEQALGTTSGAGQEPPARGAQQERGRDSDPER